MQEIIELTVNGDARTFAAPQTVESLLEALGMDRRKIAIERNEEIVPRELYATTPLASGDSVEIVHFIGGG